MVDIDKTFGSQEYNKPNIIQDHFKVSNIDKVFIHSMISLGNWHHTGEVEFIRGNTKDTQKFRGSNMDDVIYQIKQFQRNYSNMSNNKQYVKKNNRKMVL